MRREILECDMCGKDLSLSIGVPFWRYDGKSSGDAYIPRDEIDLCSQCEKKVRDFIRGYRTASEDAKHGKLVDADALIESLSVNPLECPGCPEPEYLEDVITLLETAPEV